MSFDLINTSMIFQVYINHVLHELVNDFYVVYLDNILVFFKIKEEHYKHLELVIEHLQQVKLYTNLKKCDFLKTEVKYLDFLINKNNLCMNSSCVKIISD